MAQYSPTDFVSKQVPFGMLNFSLDGKLMYYDKINFVQRAFRSKAEIIEWFPLGSPARKGRFDICMNTGGTLGQDGIITGGVDSTWWFSAGEADVNLIQKFYSVLEIDALFGAIVNKNLQNVTDGAGNNRTSNSLQVTGASQLNSTLNSLSASYSSTESLLRNVSSNKLTGMVQFTPVYTALTWESEDNQYAIFLRNQTGLSAGAEITSRLKVSPAENNDEAVTLQQLISLAPSIPDATTIVKGKIKLAGDLGGTADLPTVPGLVLKANVAGQVFTGDISAPNLSGTNTGDQDLTPYITTEIFNSAMLLKANVAGQVFTGTISATNLSGTNTGDQDLSGYELKSNRGVVNGYASLDATGKVPTAQLPAFPVDSNLLHKTGDETKAGRLTLATPTGAVGGSVGGSSSPPFTIIGGYGGLGTADTGSVFGGAGGNMNIQLGGGGSASGNTTGFASSGSGGSILLQAGEGGQIFAPNATTKIYNSGGSAILQAGQSYGTAIGGNASVKAGNNISTGSGTRGGSTFLVAGWGNNDGSDNPLYNGSIFCGVSDQGVVRGNTVVGSTVDDYINRFQVTGNSIFNGKAKVTSAPLDPTDITNKLYVDGLVTDVVTKTTSQLTGLTGEKTWNGKHTFASAASTDFKGSIRVASLSGGGLTISNSTFSHSIGTLRLSNGSGNPILTNDEQIIDPAYVIVNPGVYLMESGANTATLPAVGTSASGYRITIINRSGITCTVNSNGGLNNIDRSLVVTSTVSLLNGEQITLYCRSNQWYEIK